MRTSAPYTVRVLTRRLTGVHDPMALFAGLRAVGAARSMLRRSGGRAVILCDAALRLEATGSEARLEALSLNGEALLETVANAAADHRSGGDATHATFAFPAPDPKADEAARMAAPTALDLAHALTAAPLSEDGDEPLALCALGIAGFDALDQFEALPAVDKPMPDLVFELAETLVVVEVSGAVRLVAMAAGGAEAHRLHSLAAERLARLAARIDQLRVPPVPEAEPQAAQVDCDHAKFGAIVTDLKARIRAGDAFQIVPSRAFKVPCGDPLAAFRRLVAADPSTLHFFCETPHGILFGASPEPALEVQGRRVAITPMAGTRPRADSVDADDRTEVDLRLDAKEVAEHLMLVDLGRNDVARIAAPNSRRVPSLMRVERYAKVMHLASTVEGRLAEGLDRRHAMRACLPVGTLSGAPKLAAIAAIRQAEGEGRGAYGGAMCLMDGRGGLDSAVVIRSAFVADGIATVRAGAGVVLDSDPAAEAAETSAKARAVLDALGASA